MFSPAPPDGGRPRGTYFSDQRFTGVNPSGDPLETLVAYFRQLYLA